jgi:glucose-1-phosphate thymidylyltransferase
LCQVPNPEKFRVADLDEHGSLLSLAKRPLAPKSDLALVGIYLLRQSIFPILHELKSS